MKNGTIFCPNCGTTHNIVILDQPPQTIKLIHASEVNTDWILIKKAIMNGDAASVLSIGDKITTVLKDGQTVQFTVAAINPYGENEVAFVMEDCLAADSVMNAECHNKGGWYGSDLRTKLNTEILALLPDELVAVIKPRQIVQKHKGDTFTSVDKLWVPSHTELVGGENEVDQGDVHFPLFQTPKSRVKNRNGDYEWYWTRTPRASSSTNFCSVLSNGYSYYYSASISFGVAFGFLI